MSFPSRDQFPARVVELVRAKFPLVKIHPVDSSFSLRVNGHVASLENVYRLAVLRPDEMQQHINRWIVELLRAAEGTQDQQGTFAQLKERIYPMVLASLADDVAHGLVVSQPLIDGLGVAYAIDNDRTISYLAREHFNAWNISLEQLHDQAMANLVAHSQEMEAHATQDEDGRINLILFQRGDGYDASRILLPTLHERLREHLGSPFVAAIPNRDILLCFRNDEPTVARLGMQIADDFRQMPHQVTDKLFLITPDGIAPRAEN
jgi:uncharacterized protein YtpQ (UPF0354 family)